MKTTYQQTRSFKRDVEYRAHLDGIEDMAIPAHQPQRLNGDFDLLAFGVNWDITCDTDWEGLGA